MLRSSAFSRHEKQMSISPALVRRRSRTGHSGAVAPPQRGNVMRDTPRVNGPASYFPSIEKTYGQPVGHWLALLVAQGGRRHMELVAFLKTEHGLGHGHANALVAHHLRSG
jgi:hypothetical protein